MNEIKEEGNPNPDFSRFDELIVQELGAQPDGSALEAITSLLLRHLDNSDLPSVQRGDTDSLSSRLGALAEIGEKFTDNDVREAIEIYKREREQEDKQKKLYESEQRTREKRKRRLRYAIGGGIITAMLVGGWCGDLSYRL